MGHFIIKYGIKITIMLNLKIKVMSNAFQKIQYVAIRIFFDDILDPLSGIAINFTRCRRLLSSDILLDF